MEIKYHIPVEQAPGKAKPVGKFIISRSQECINCNTCGRVCIYGIHHRIEGDPRTMAEPEHHLCRNCFMCVRECPRDALVIMINPEYEELGDEYYKPDLVLSIRKQAEDGKIPVFGAGYKGPFAGSGYDSVWTDMSEIVRPTRDGIHGREFISTTVTLGRRLPDLTGLLFDEQGSLISDIPATREIPLPIVFNRLPVPVPSDRIDVTMAVAATRLRTFTILDIDRFRPELRPYMNHIIFSLRGRTIADYSQIIEWASIIELEEGDSVFRRVEEARAINPALLSVISVPLDGDVVGTTEYLAREGAEIIHLAANPYGTAARDETKKLISVLPDVHRNLVNRGLRDQVTIIASGGIALAEHVPKTIILGTDAVALDVPLLLALECTFCQECLRDKSCPVGLENLDVEWSSRRIMNLMASWNNQLLEVLGAMGLREVRRLRGERGRAIFLRELEKETIPLFGRILTEDEPLQARHDRAVTGDSKSFDPGPGGMSGE